MFNNRRDGRPPCAGDYGGRGSGLFVTPSYDAAGAPGSWASRRHPDRPDERRRQSVISRRVGAVACPANNEPGVIQCLSRVISRL
jgi:hypothetical protein